MSEALLDALLRTSLHGALFVGAVWAVCRLLPDLPAAVRLERRAEVRALVGDWIGARSAEQAVDALRAIGVAAAVVATPDDLLHHDPQLASRGFWQTLAHPVMGQGLYHGVAAAFSRTPTRYRSGAPLLGQHNDELQRRMVSAPADKDQE